MTRDLRQLRDEQAKALERERVAQGWSHFLRVVERLRRLDAGEPLLRVERGS